MPENESLMTDSDWLLTTFEGARREQLRRWSQLPLEDVIRALEEMHDIARTLGNGSLADRQSYPSSSDL